MNRAELLRLTGNLMVHLKTYNYKLCKKGLLERGLEMKILIENFMNFENEWLKKTSGLDCEHDEMLDC